MRTRIGLAAAIAVVLLECLGSPEARAQAANTGAQAKARQPDVKRLEAQIKQFNRLLPRQARMLAEQPCGHRDCSVTIQMKEATVSIDGKDVKICVAVLPISLKFDQTSSGNPPK